MPLTIFHGLVSPMVSGASWVLGVFVLARQRGPPGGHADLSEQCAVLLPNFIVLASKLVVSVSDFLDVLLPVTVNGVNLCPKFRSHEVLADQEPNRAADGEAHDFAKQKSRDRKPAANLSAIRGRIRPVDGTVRILDDNAQETLEL